MAFTKTVLLLSFCTIGLSASETIQSGVRFVEMGALEAATGSWNLLIHLDLQPLTAQVHSFQNAAQAMKEKLLRPTSQQDGAKNSTTLPNTQNIKENLTSAWFAELPFLEHQMHEIEEEFAELTSLGAKRRRRRSLIPIVGRGLGYLFGLATKKDVRRVVQLANVTAHQEEDIVHNQELQLTLLNKLNNEQKRQNQLLSTLTNMQDELQKGLNELDRLRHDIVLTNKFSMLWRYLQAGLTSFRHEVSRLGRIVASLANGNLTPGLMSDSDITKVLREIDKKLPAGWDLAIPIKDTIWPYYESLAVSATPTVRGWAVYIPIPIRLKMIGTFQLYKGLSFPLFNTKTNTSIVTELPSTYLAVSKKQLQHIALDTKDLDDCLHFDNNYVCPNIATIQEQSGGCMWNAFHQNLPKMATECTHRLLAGKTTPKQIDNGMWSYAFESETKINLTCPRSGISDEKETASFKFQTAVGQPETHSRCWEVCTAPNRSPSTGKPATHPRHSSPTSNM